MAFSCSSNVWGLNCYVENTWHQRGEQCKLLAQRGIVPCECFLPGGRRWGRRETQNTRKSFSPWQRSDRVHYFLVSYVCLVKHSVMVINMWLLCQCTSREHSVTAILSQLDFIACAAFPSASRQLNKGKCWSKKGSGNEALCHYSDEKRQSSASRRVSPAYSSRRVKHQLILYGAVLGEKVFGIC